LLWRPVRRGVGAGGRAPGGRSARPSHRSHQTRMMCREHGFAGSRGLGDTHASPIPARYDRAILSASTAAGVTGGTCCESLLSGSLAQRISPLSRSTSDHRSIRRDRRQASRALCMAGGGSRGNACPVSFEPPSHQGKGSPPTRLPSASSSTNLRTWHVCCTEERGPFPCTSGLEDGCISGCGEPRRFSRGCLRDSFSSWFSDDWVSNTRSDLAGPWSPDRPVNHWRD
jgi:hypothetical protein